MIAGPGILVTVLAFALMIGPLVFVHEMGHYWVARWFGVKAEAFSIGFGREIAGFTDRRGTRWKIGWLPLGGYVRFAGDMNPASQPDAAWLALPAAERNRTFQAKPLWQRALIVAAGPAVNMLAAILILSGFAMVDGEISSPPTVLPIVTSLVPGSPATRAGLQLGDVIRTVDGRPVRNFTDLTAIGRRPIGDKVRLGYLRHGRPQAATLTVSRIVITNPDGSSVVGHLGFTGQLKIDPVPWWRAPWVGVRQTGIIIATIADRLGELITGQRSIKELSGPVGTAHVAGQQFERGAEAFIVMIALVSINLGFINLLPIPILDGGHLLFYAIEAVRRRPAEPAAVEWAFRGGLAALLALMIFVTINDLAGFGLWKGLAGLIG